MPSSGLRQFSWRMETSSCPVGVSGNEPGFASSVAYGIDAITQGLGVYLQKIHVLSEMNKTIACTIAKAERELGYDPKIALREGMKRSIAWVLERGPIPPS